jgi:hypothetical protein
MGQQTQQSDTADYTTDPPASHRSSPLWQRAAIIDKAVRSDRQAPNANVGGLS